MQISSRLLFRTAIVLLGAMLCLGLLLAYGIGDRDARAISGTEWDTVRDALNNYVANQYSGSAADEYGFTVTAGDLKSRIDSDGDGNYLDEGDDAAGNPVLVDVLSSQTTKIPTTVSRSNWNTTTLQTTSVNEIDSWVDKHEAAGFSTDVVVYCLTGHTEAAAAGGLGAIAGAGGFGSGTPEVLSLKYGRSGWGPTTNTKTFTATNTIGPADALPAPYASATQPDTTCNGKTGAELVRCVAERAVSATGGNVGNGINPPTTTYQAIDLRPGGGMTIDQANATYNIPVNTIFNTGMNYMNPAATPKKLFVGDTQHMAGMVATGAEMLGYDSAFLQWGLANYNNTIGEIYNSSDNYGYAQVAGSDPVDTTAPTVTVAPSASSVTETAADISRTTNEPATMKIEYGTTSGGPYTNTVNNTILNASKTVGISSLTASTTYYVKVTSYDGWGNGTTSDEISFTTADPPPPPCTPAKPTLAMSMGNVYWASMADYTARELSVDLSLANNGANNASAVTISGATVVPASASMINTPYNVGAIAASNTGNVTVKFNVPMGVLAINASMYGTAIDDCDATNYPMP